jgi:hypothetical protein
MVENPPQRSTSTSIATPVEASTRRALRVARPGQLGGGRTWEAQINGRGSIYGTVRFAMVLCAREVDCCRTNPLGCRLRRFPEKVDSKKRWR